MNSLNIIIVDNESTDKLVRSTINCNNEYCDIEIYIKHIDNVVELESNIITNYSWDLLFIDNSYKSHISSINAKVKCLTGTGDDSINKSVKFAMDNNLMFLYKPIRRWSLMEVLSNVLRNNNKVSAPQYV